MRTGDSHHALCWPPDVGLCSLSPDLSQAGAWGSWVIWALSGDMKNRKQNPRRQPGEPA